MDEAYEAGYINGLVGAPVPPDVTDPEGYEAGRAVGERHRATAVLVPLEHLQGAIGELRAYAEDGDDHSVGICNCATVAAIESLARWDEAGGRMSNVFTREEVDSIYVDAHERFVVSLIVGYDDETMDQPATPKAAAHWALELTRDGGSSGTTWCVFDRATGEKHRFYQSDIETLDD